MSWTDDRAQDEDGGLQAMRRLQKSERILIRGGLDLAFDGAPHQTVRTAAPFDSVAISGRDFPGVRPGLKVETGEWVRAGQIVFVDRKRADIAFTSPVSGSIAAINRTGHTLDSVVIRIDGDDTVSFAGAQPDSPEACRRLLLESGLWPTLLTRPFGRIPDPDAVADALFVTAMDTNPMAADPKIVIGLYPEQFRTGLEVLSLLTEGPVFVCHAPGRLPDPPSNDRIKSVAFAGHHPAGLAGTHIHHLMPVGFGRTVWQIGYQDVIAIGHLVLAGKVWGDRIVSLAGSGIRQPALVVAKRGVSLDDLLSGALTDQPSRVLSGPPLTGRQAGFLGFYHNQVTAIEQDSRAGAGILTGLRQLLDDKAGGAIIAREAFERALPLDILPVPLLRALCIGDIEMARDLGCLELLEEDMALLTYLCTSGNDYGLLLRVVLDELAEESR